MIWGMTFIGGFTALAFLYAFYRSEKDQAERYFESLHGEAVDFPKLGDQSSFFIGTVIKLEIKRLRRVAARQRYLDEMTTVHAFHPRTPARWLCGKTSDRGGVSIDREKLTCVMCISFYRAPLDFAQSMGQLFDEQERNR